MDDVPAANIIKEGISLEAESTGVPLGHLISARHKLTALIKTELYGGGSKVEGRAALIARRQLDEFFFRTVPSDLAQGDVSELEPLKRAIILETLTEQISLLEQARDGGSWKGIQAGMLMLMDDPDRLERFNDEDKATIRKIAHGWSFLATIRFNRLHEVIRRRATPYLQG